MLEQLKIQDITNDEQRYIANTIGIDAYVRLVEEFGGTSIYILKKDSLIRSIRDNLIRSEFNGSNYSSLAKKYNLTDMTIRNIVDNNPLSTQIKFNL